MKSKIKFTKKINALSKTRSFQKMLFENTMSHYIRA